MGDIDGKPIPHFSIAPFAVNLGLALKILVTFPLVFSGISASLDIVTESVGSRWISMLHQFVTLVSIVLISIGFHRSLAAFLAIVGDTLTMLTNVCVPALFYLLCFRSKGVTVKAVMAGAVGMLGLWFATTSPING